MADEAAAPAPLPKPWPQSRPRRTRKPTVSYRRRPGAASRPTPGAARGASRLLGVLRFVPFRGFVDLFFGGVSSNAERAAATEQLGIDYLSERGTARLARGTERRVRVSRAASTAASPVYSSPVLAEVLVSGAAAADRVAAKPLPLPDPELLAVGNLSVASEIFPGLPGNFAESVGIGSTPAGGPRSLTNLEKLLDLPPLPRFTELFSSPVESPLLTTFNVPGVASSPLARPELLAEPLPEPDAQRCRCRARKRKAGKPGKGFFTINRRGEERRQYWR